MSESGLWSKFLKLQGLNAGGWCVASGTSATPGSGFMGLMAYQTPKHCTVVDNVMRNILLL